MAAYRTNEETASDTGPGTMDGARARARSRLLVFMSALLACAAPEIREDCRFVHEHVPPPPMPSGFAKLDRALLGRLMLGTAAVRELSERPRLRTRIIPLQSIYASRNTVALRRLFAEDLLGHFCARLEVARTRAVAGQVREAGVAYQGLLVTSQVLQLNVALLQMAVYADEAGQPVAQIQQMALRPLVELEPLLDASLGDDVQRLTAELPTGVERYNASIVGLDRWAADLKLGTERVKVARVLWDSLLASAAAVEMAAAMAEVAAANSIGPPAGLVALAGSGGTAQLVLNRAVVLEIGTALEQLLAAGALDGAIIAGLHAMAASTNVPPDATRPCPLVQPAARGTESLRVFTGDGAAGHFQKHSSEVMRAFGKSSYNLKDYVTDANHVIRAGTWVPELNGYVKLIGGVGSAKAAFVGMTCDGANIATFHIKTIKELARSAPSLGWTP